MSGVGTIDMGRSSLPFSLVSMSPCWSQFHKRLGPRSPPCHHSQSPYRSASKREEAAEGRPGKQLWTESHQDMLTEGGALRQDKQQLEETARSSVQVTGQPNLLLPNTCLASASINLGSQSPDATRSNYYVTYVMYPSPIIPAHPIAPPPFQSPLVPYMSPNVQPYRQLDISPQTPQSQVPYYHPHAYNTPSTPTP